MKLTPEQMQEIIVNYLKLPEAKKEVLRDFSRNSEVAKILRLLVGKEFMELVGALKAPNRGNTAPR